MRKAGRKGKATPAELDHLFKRHVISEEQYKEFWPAYWKGDADQRQKLIDSYTEEAIEEGEVSSGPLRSNKEAARQDLGDRDGYIVRRDKSGRFSKHGGRYQALFRRKKK